MMILLPAGLIRSKGTKKIREEIIKKCQNIIITIINNNARFFAIDTRFKFLLLDCVLSKPSTQANDIKIVHSDCAKNDFIVSEIVKIPTQLLKQARPDLTLPEIRSSEEMSLYFKIYENGCDWAKSPEWSYSISRELDMTNDKGSFVTHPDENSVEIIEGRMVQQHWFAVKKYCFGAGRAARWELADGEIKPQFWIKKNDLSSETVTRIIHERVGYCDIAGQTNERSMMSAIIPADVVCGNKVPTIRFVNSENGKRELLWVGVTNSFVFDWMVRRIISTTVNYFILLSVPMPAIELDSELAKSIITATQEIRKLKKTKNPNDTLIASLRCQIDISVAKAYGLNFQEIELILKDFPLLDRKQKPINGEKKSSVTHDYLLSNAANHYGYESNFYSYRYQIANTQGAIPYMPTDVSR
jgi:hypothetical protein